MKLLTAILILLSSTTLMAAEKNFFELAEGEQFISAITEGVVSIKRKSRNCRPMLPCTTVMPGAEVKIKLSLSGCLDRLVSFYNVEQNGDGSTDILVTALNIHNEASKSVFCTALPIEILKIDVGSLAGDINVKFVGDKLESK